MGLRPGIWLWSECLSKNHRDMEKDLEDTEMPEVAVAGRICVAVPLGSRQAERRFQSSCPLNSGDKEVVRELLIRAVEPGSVRP